MEEGLDGAGGSRCHLCVQVFGVEEQQLGGGAVSGEHCKLHVECACPQLSPTCTRHRLIYASLATTTCMHGFAPVLCACVHVGIMAVTHPELQALVWALLPVPAIM